MSLPLTLRRIRDLIVASRGVWPAVLLVCGCIELLIALWDITNGGFYFRVLGIRISSWDAYKPFRIGMVAFVLAMWLHDRDSAPDATTWHRLRRIAPWIAAAAAVASLWLGIRFGIHSAGGADAYGYVSEAHAWAAGRLHVANPLASLTRELGPAVAPLGYQLSDDRASLVPIYSPGLPLMMAAALKVDGPQAVYLVVPLLGGLAVWLTYVLARRLANARAAMMAALLVASSPIFLFQSFQPMSDVPVTTFWIASWVCATANRRWAPLAAGLAVSAAILVRPNLAPLTVVVAFVIAGQRPVVPRLAMFAATVLPGCLFIAVLNQRLYGSPLRSGYGPLATLYAWDRLGDNLRRYTTWLIDLHTPAILLAFAAPFVTRTKAALAMLAFAAGLLLLYLFYFAFDTWPFLRFLLPAIPLLFILMSGTTVALVERAPVAYRGAILFLICTLLPGWYIAKARDITVFAAHRAEYRYVAVGETLGRELEPRAAVVTLLHSGSVRMYGNRVTVRWDLIEPDNLDFSLTALREGGYVPYFVLDEWDEQPFRERFSPRSGYGRLDWPPMIEYRGTAKTRVYALADRDRYKAGASIVTRVIAAAKTEG